MGFRLLLRLVLAAAVSSRSLVAQDDADDDAKFNAKAALISARLAYLTSQSYAGVTAKSLKEKNPDLRFLDDAPSTGPAVLSLKVLSATHLRIAVYGIQTCWGVREEGRQDGVATLYAKRPGPATECKATSFKDGDFRETSWTRRGTSDGYDSSLQGPVNRPGVRSAAGRSCSEPVP